MNKTTTETKIFTVSTLDDGVWVHTEDVESKGRKEVCQALRDAGCKEGTFKVRLAE